MPLTIGTQRAARYLAINMDVSRQCRCPSVYYGTHADLSVEPLRIGAECRKRLLPLPVDHGNSESESVSRGACNGHSPSACRQALRQLVT